MAFLALASLILRLVLADAYSWSRWNFYLPLPVVFGVGFAAAMLSRTSWPRRATLALVATVLALPSLAIEQPLLVARPPFTTPARQSITVACWNVMSYVAGRERVKARLRDLADRGTDIVCLVEGMDRGAIPSDIREALGPDYNWTLGHRLAIASRFPILESRQVSAGQLRLLRAEIGYPGPRLSVLLADMRTPRSRNDSTAFDDLRAALLDGNGDAVLVGDFNVPRGSRQLARATRGWTDAFIAAGTNRYLASWPSAPIPLWQLDHAFCRGMLVSSATLEWTLASDHSLVYASFEYPGGSS